MAVEGGKGGTIDVPSLPKKKWPTRVICPSEFCCLKQKQKVSTCQTRLIVTWRQKAGFAVGRKSRGKRVNHGCCCLVHSATGTQVYGWVWIVWEVKRESPQLVMSPGIQTPATSHQGFETSAAV